MRMKITACVYLQLIAALFATNEVSAATLKEILIGHEIQCLGVTTYRFRKDGSIDVGDINASRSAPPDSRIKKNEVKWTDFSASFKSFGDQSTIYFDEKGKVTMKQAGDVGKCNIF